VEFAILADRMEQPDVTVVATLSGLMQLYKIESQSFKRSGCWLAQGLSAYELVKLRLNTHCAFLLHWCFSSFLDLHTVNTLLKL
jgi:hypothetical protein